LTPKGAAPTLLGAAAWLAVLLAVGLLLDVSDRAVHYSALVQETALLASEPAGPATGPIVLEAAATLEDAGFGRLPDPRVVFDPASQGRLYSATSTSADGGRTWEPLRSHDLTSLRLSGSSLGPIVGPEGRLLFTEAELSGPLLETRMPGLAHAVEWSGGNWRVLWPADPASPASTPVRAATYLPSGEALVALEERVRLADGREWESPARAALLLAASDGQVYAIAKERTRFALWRTRGPEGPWLPMGGSGPIVAAAEAGGVLYAAGQRLGRWSGSRWSFSVWPFRFQPSGLAVHPRAPLVAAWGGGGLAVSRDGGRSFLRARLGPFQVAQAAFDPFRTDVLLVSSASEARFLRLGTVR
jgi:hypothetical protein